ncbi:apiosidase-like domain-containing protein [Marinivivus vitaminiproducens]|uniref:apiosidase-like domain-containing protein n=1 Tax=Marinivivus vitaminiproducens TaxID=3035935 RepID=UPI0027AA4307|nr:DUF5060 domain-containing protein [Geminicoccaceae bacterium SCSIO 64248]
MNPTTLPRRSVGEWSFTSRTAYRSPFADVQVDAVFTAPSGRRLAQPAFYDGDDVWRVRFNPGEAGSWRFELISRPHDGELTASGAFEVTERDARGFLNATPGRAWGFHFENGEPAFILGDTVYDLFGMQYCGGDVAGFVRRRAEQGFNLLRVRLSVSRFHPPDGHCDWQTRRCWPWGGSETAPRFDLMNLDWFRSVDQTVRMIDELGIGIEMIAEGWGFEFPFNHRAWFTAEWEELWLRYLIARYDAFTSVYFWTPLNEYEYYPNGDWHHTAVADRWAMRIGRWIKSVAPHGHVLAMHNGPRLPPFAERFRADPEAIDAIMFQDWGTRDAERGWLAAGIEDAARSALEGWRGSAVLAEWGYERNPALELKLPSHEHCDRDHTRRGAWRGAFSGLGIIHGFENSWSPWMILGEDQPGLADLLIVRDFFTTIAPFASLRPGAPVEGDHAHGERPLVLVREDGGLTLYYLPAGGVVTARADKARWFDPRSARICDARPEGDGFRPPLQADPHGRPLDWILMLEDRPVPQAPSEDVT